MEDYEDYKSVVSNTTFHLSNDEGDILAVAENLNL